MNIYIYIYIYIYISAVSDKCLYEYINFTQCDSYPVLSAGACTVMGHWELSHPAWLTVGSKSDVWLTVRRNSVWIRKTN